MNNHPNSNLCYFLTEFPERTQTFVRDEIISLRQRGMNITILAFRPGKGFSTEDAKHYTDATVQYTPAKYISIVKRLLLFSHFLIFKPYKFLRTLATFRSYESKLVNYDITYVMEIAYKVQLLNIQHIHVHFAWGASDLALFVSKLTGIPFSITTHANDIFTNPIELKKKIKASKNIITISQFNKDYLRKNYTEDNNELNNKIKVIHCGVNISEFSNTINKKESEVFQIFCVGRLVEKKGIEFLIKACSLLTKKTNRIFRCEIIGDGPLMNELVQLRNDLQLENIVNFSGPDEHENILSRLRNADVFVLPCVVASNNDMDGIPVSLMEAMALGIPVISTRVSGIPELIKAGGFLCEQKQDAELSERINDIMQMDLNDRKSFGLEGKKVIEKEFNRNIEVTKLISNFFGK